MSNTRIASEKGTGIVLAIRLPADAEARLDALARATGRTKPMPVANVH